MPDKPKTVKVRIAVCISNTGEVGACAVTQGISIAQAASFASEVAAGDFWRDEIWTREVELPTEVQAEVEGQP